MQKRIISVFLAVVLLAGLVIPVSAEESLGAVSAADLESATKVITQAVSELNGDQAAAVSDIFGQFMNVVGTGGTILTAINGSVNFLKLIGVMKDANAEALTNITQQLQSISETIAIMDKKLDNISAQMSKLQASAEFNARTQKSLLLEQNWKDFVYRYEEEGMDELMTQYSSMLLNALKSWCRNGSETARKVNDVDNSRIILVYTDGGNELYYFSGNAIPSDLPADARVLVLSDALLPKEVTWDMNAYRTSIQSGIADLINAAVSAGDFSVFETVNFPEFSEGPTPELIAQVAEDAVNVLAYRTACGCINGDSSFTLEVKRQFLNYCTHLLAADEGIDAVIKTFFLTHAFEFEVSSDLKAFCDETAVKAATYGAFAINVLGLSDFASDADKTSVMNAYCNTLNTIGQAKSNSLTGKKQYCYITNSELFLGELNLYATATVETKEDGSVNTFRGGSGSSITTRLSGSWDRSFQPDRNSMIGDSNAILLAYTMQSSSGPVTFDYLRTHLSNGYIQDCSAFVSSYNNEETLPLDSGAPMRVTNLSGDYFTNDSNVSFSNLPSSVKEKTKNFIHRRMVSGTVVNLATGSTANQMLSGLAVYGENHWYWYHDEIAILGNNPYQSNFMTFLDRTQQSYQFYFTYDYSQSVTYNVLVCRPVEAKLMSIGEYDPLQSYAALLEQLQPSPDPIEPEQPVGFTDSPAKAPFRDVSSGDWYYDAVCWAAKNEIAEGTGNSMFSPLDPCTRAQVVTFLWRCAGSPAAEADLPFTDLQEDAYYTDAIRWAVSEGIAKGVSETKFAPDAPCTRAQIVTFLARWCGVQDAVTDTPFSDVKPTDFCAAAVTWAADNGITKGTSKTAFSPDTLCTRAQAVTFLFRLADE